MANKYSAIERLIRLQKTMEWADKSDAGQWTIINEAKEELHALNEKVKELEGEKDIKKYSITKNGEFLKIVLDTKQNTPFTLNFSRKDFLSLLSAMRQAAIAMGWL